MKTPVSIVSGLLFLTLLALPASSSDIDRVVEQMAERLLLVESLDQEAVMKTEMVLHGTEHDFEQKLNLAFKRPNQLLAAMDHIRLISDGRALYAVGTHENRYLSWPIEESLEKTLEESEAGINLGFWSTTKALLSSDPAKYLKELKESGAEVLPDEEVDGVSCWVIRHSWPGMQGPEGATVTSWIDQSYGVVRRAVAEMEMDSDTDDDDAHQMVSMTYETKSLKVNEPIDDARFAYTPGSTTKKVDTFMALWMSDEDVVSSDWSTGPGLSRFELSGKPAPNFELELLDGEIFRLSEQRGKVVILDFWATWCGPCVAALPSIRKMHEEYRDRGVVVVGVSSDRIRQEKQVRNMVRDKGLEYAIGIDVTDIGHDYLVQGIPCVVVIGADGIVQGRKVGFSSAGMKEMLKDVDRLLDGEELASAKPMTDAEIEEMKTARVRRMPSSRTTMDERYFKPVWQSEVRARESMSRFGNRLQVRIAPRTFALSQNDKVSVIGATDGKPLVEIALPSEARKGNEMQQGPTHLYLRKPLAGVLISAQQFYRKEETESGSTSYRSERITVRAHGQDGAERWNREFGENEYLQAFDSLPVSQGEDVLLLGFWNQFLLIDAEGHEVVSQALGHSDRVDVVQEADGRILFYLSGSVNACYELLVPRKEPAIEIAGE